jgi:hypothetical protein
MHIKVYIYGSLTVVFLFQANLLAGGNAGVWMAIACAGSSYFASLAEWAFCERLCSYLWVSAFVLGVLSFLSLLL